MSNQIHLSQTDFSRVRPLSVKCIFILSPSAPFAQTVAHVFDDQQGRWQPAVFWSMIQPHLWFIYCQNLNRSCFTPLSLGEPLFSAPFCPSLPPVLQFSPELIYANLCSLAGAKTSRVGSSIVITSIVCVCTCGVVGLGWPQQTLFNLIHRRVKQRLGGRLRRGREIIKRPGPYECALWWHGRDWI